LKAFAPPPQRRSRLGEPPKEAEAPGNVDKPEVAPAAPPPPLPRQAAEQAAKEPMRDLNFKVPESFFYAFGDLAHARRMKKVDLLREMFESFAKSLNNETAKSR
jgi:hypothetical protein